MAEQAISLPKHAMTLLAKCNAVVGVATAPWVGLQTVVVALGDGEGDGNRFTQLTNPAMNLILQVPSAMGISV